MVYGAIYHTWAIAMELPQGLEPGTSLFSIFNLNHFAKSTCICAHEKSFYIYNLDGYVEKHKVLYMSIELLCCNFKITICLVDSHSNYLVKWTFLSFYNVVTVPTSLVYSNTDYSRLQFHLKTKWLLISSCWWKRSKDSTSSRYRVQSRSGYHLLDILIRWFLYKIS
jgi:hypothetical protein